MLGGAELRKVSAVSRRRILGISGALMASAGASALVGCGGVAGSAAGRSDISWLFWGSTSEVTANRKLIASFQSAYPKYGVAPNVIPGGGQQLVEKLQILAGGGQGPDVFQSAPLFMPWASLNGFFAPLDPFIKASNVRIADYVPATIRAATFNGSVYALPYLVNYFGVFYNKAIFDKAHVAYPKPGWTWQDFLSTAQAIASNGSGKTGYWGVYPGDLSINGMLPWIWMNGGTVFDNDAHPTRSTMSDPRTVAAIQWHADWALKHKVAPVPANISGEADPFLAGTVGMLIQEIGGMAGLSQQIKTFEWDFAPLPVGVKGSVNIAGSAYEGIYSHSHLKEEAWKFVSWYCGSGGLPLLTKLGHGVPPLKSLFKTFLNMPGYPKSKQLMLDQLHYLRPMPKSTVFAAAQVTVYNNNLMDVFNGLGTASKACAQIDTQINALLAKG